MGKFIKEQNALDLYSVFFIQPKMVTYEFT